VGPDYTLGMDAMLHGCQAVTGGGVEFTRVPLAFVEENKVEFPIWVPSHDNPYAGYGQVSNARAIKAGLTFRPLATTVTDLLAWFRSLPAERQATVKAGITREQETKLLQAWQARKGA
jgi:2'-hydroxyisoflavone reductase